MTSTPTAYAVSPDSGEHWTVEGAWPVAAGVHRIPLPLPMDGLRAVNVYVLTTDDGLVLVDGGWAIQEAREVLERGLAAMGAGVGDIRRFLVTHVHRDHYTMARVLGTETGAEVVLGRDEQPGIEAIQTMADLPESPFAALLRSAGAPDVAEQWNRFRERSEETPDLAGWQPPDRWLEGDTTVEVGARTLDAVLTPGHTPGHYVFADRAASLLFAGDHVLPTITPSIGFTHPPAPSPLSDFMASLTKVRALPDLQLLPAHGPVAPSSHARVDALLAHHEERLAACLRALEAGAHTSAEVAGQLPWTRHEHAFASLDVFNQGLAALETKAHLEVLVARGRATREVAGPDAVVSFGVPTAGPTA